ncbi:MAG: hypothetical protein KGI58_02795 [Patescibacteria group bacterium]|nr:hypothetical protein [Patescibacteria group bacterium]
MEKISPLQKGNFLFLWKMEVDRDTKGISFYLSEHIRKCEYDEEATRRGRIDSIIMDQMIKLFKDNKSICFFVHDNQFKSNPLFCMLYDIATPEEHSFLHQIVLVVSEKFRLDSFKNEEIKETFLKFLYSEENIKKLKKFGLEIKELQYY